MIKEPKDIDFYTTGKQPSEQDFARISEWIKKDKEKKKSHQTPLESDQITSQNNVSEKHAMV